MGPTGKTQQTQAPADGKPTAPAREDRLPHAAGHHVGWTQRGGMDVR